MGTAESQEVRSTLVKDKPGIPVEVQRKQWEEVVSGFILPPRFSTTPADVSGMTGEWIALADSPVSGPTILYVHGGGFVAGSCNTHRELATRIAESTRARVLLFDYRLAPEFPFPAALDDVVRAYLWLREETGAAGRVAIGADSSGAAPALAALTLLRDRGVPLPQAAFFISAHLDLTTSGPTIESNADLDPLVSRECLREATRYYLGDHDPRDPLASPLFGELHDLPPMLLQVGGHEMLLSDSTRLAEKAEAAGVEVHLDVWSEMWHVWHGWAENVPEGRQAIEQIGEFVRLRL